MYIDTSPKRNIFFTALTLVLVGSVFATIHYRDKIAPALSIRNIEKTVALSFGNFVSLHHITLLKAFAKTAPTKSPIPPKTLPFTDNFDINTGWRAMHGNILFNGQSLYVFSTTTAAVTELLGTSQFTDYEYHAKIFLEKGGRVSLFSRASGANDYVSCQFTANDIRIVEKNNGKQMTDAHIRNSLHVPLANLGIAISGNTVTCFEDSRAVVVAALRNASVQGGIAIGVSGELPGVSIYINSLDAKRTE